MDCLRRQVGPPDEYRGRPGPVVVSPRDETRPHALDRDGTLRDDRVPGVTHGWWAADTQTEDTHVIASALPLLLIVAAIVLLGATGNLFSSSPFAIAAQAAAVALSVWARISFRKGEFRVTAAPGGTSIIRSGPYRFIRHPMYAAALLFVWAAVASHPSTWTIAIGVAGTALVIARVFAEERLLRATYPEYLDYSRSTKALIPYVF
jgi:protein-S-isoprenylcysteine O-methyltransferase Ste14